jgi:hypothetical protein
MPALPQIKFLRTDGVKLTCSDLPGAGGFTLEVGPPVVPVPLKLVFNASGVELSGGPASLKLSPTSIGLTIGAASVSLSPVSVSLNNGALEVM